MGFIGIVFKCKENYEIYSNVVYLTQITKCKMNKQVTDRMFGIINILLSILLGL